MLKAIAVTLAADLKTNTILLRLRAAIRLRNARDDRVRGTAAQALLDRGFGKPKVEIQNTNADFRDALEQVQGRLR